MKTLYPHQLDAVEYLKLGGRYLFMEPRVGKTLPTIVALRDLGLLNSALILAPLSVCSVWKTEIEDVGGVAVNVQGTKPKKLKLLETKGTKIVTFESSWRLDLDLSQFNAIVFDEALKLQNNQSKLVKYWLQARQEGLLDNKKLIGLSGAPCPESPLQLATQCLIIQGTWFGFRDYSQYLWRNWTYNERRFKFEPLRREHERECIEKFSNWAFKKSQKDIDIGEKIFEVRRVQASNLEELTLKENLKLAHATHDKEEIAQRVAGVYTQQASSGIKIVEDNPERIVQKSNKLISVVNAVRDILDDDAEASVVVMYKFTATGVWLSNELGCELFSGAIDEQTRTRILSNFQNKISRVFVAQVEVAKMGIDLSQADTLIYAEHSWSGDTFIQSTQRTTNLTRNRPALIITYCTEFKSENFNIDEAIYKAVSNKERFNARMISLKPKTRGKNKND